MSREFVRPILVIAALAATIVMNALANALPLFGRDTGEISDRFPVLFTPAGYVFGIWGLIYLALVGYAIYQALPSQRTNPRLQRIALLFVLSCALNIAWLLAWHALLIPLSLFLMLGLLVTLIAIYERLGIGRREVPRREWLATHLPFSLYLGWITVATVANTTITLYDLGFTGFGVSDTLWAVIAITAATLIGLTVLARRGDAVFAAVLVWAFVGIAVARWGLALVAGAALVAAALVLIALLARVLGRWRPEPCTADGF